MNLNGSTTTQSAPPWVRRGTPALVIAPMEGVTDAPMREFLSERGGWSFCVSEFLRVSQDVPPAKVFLRHVPELAHGCRTKSGLPVQIQLLGGDASLLAEASRVAIGAGALGIDLNFGCPAPTVNRHDGGATLLKFPGRIREIVAAVRAAVPSRLPVSAKLRLGWDDMSAIHENADMAAEGGADWITVHGRTRMQGYTPPAYWGPIGEISRRLPIPVVANGEIWTIDDFKRCREQTGAEHFMLGRGGLADPNLALQVARELGLPGGAENRETGPLEGARAAWLPHVRRFADISLPLAPENRYVARRVKQWVRMAHQRGTVDWFDDLKRLEDLGDMLSFLAGSAAVQPPPPFTQGLPRI